MEVLRFCLHAAEHVEGSRVVRCQEQGTHEDIEGFCEVAGLPKDRAELHQRFMSLWGQLDRPTRLSLGSAVPSLLAVQAC